MDDGFVHGVRFERDDDDDDDGCVMLLLLWFLLLWFLLRGVARALEASRHNKPFAAA